MRSLGLTVADREDSGADDLGDEARGVVGEREPQGQEFRLQRHAALEVESLERRHLPGQGHTGRKKGNRRRPGDDSGTDPEHRVDFPGVVLHALRPPAKSHRGDDRDHEHRADDAGPVLEHRGRHVEATVGDEHRVADADGVARRRQGGDHDPVHEKNVQQHRNVAGELDEYVGHAADQPVAGQPEDAHRKAEQRRERDAADCDEQGVQNADRGCDQVRIAGGVVEEGRKGDVVGGWRSQKVEAEFLSDRFQVDGDVAKRQRHQGEHHRHGDDLHDDRSCLLVTPEACDRAGILDGSDRHRRLPGEGKGALARGNAPALASDFGSGRAQRNGGEYWSPPSVHSALRPRARPIGVFIPMLRSKISP